MGMKRLLLLIALSIISTAGIYAMNDKQRLDEGTERLWKEYEAAAKLDLPNQQLEILDRIKSEARTKKLPWDFKRASDLYINVASSRNWKLRESLQEARQKEVEEFGSAVLSFSYCKNDSDAVLPLIKERRSELESARNSGFYSNDHFLSTPKYGSLLAEKLIRNDYEYVLWSSWIAAKDMGRGNEEECGRFLDGVLGGRYPDAALKEFSSLDGMVAKEREKALEAYAAKYKGKAVSLLAGEELLMAKSIRLYEKNAQSEEYKAFRTECTEFEKIRKSFSGEEKEIASLCTLVADCIRQMDGKEIIAEITNNVLTVSLKNLDRVELSISKDGKKVFKTELKNPKGSYCAPDTVSFELPAMDDGSYDFKCSNGKDEYNGHYEKYSLSVASRTDSQGTSIFLADAQSGEPVKSTDFILLDNSGKQIAEYKGMKLDAFTLLPKEISKQLKNNEPYSQQFYCRCTDSQGFVRLSRKSSLAGITERNRYQGDNILGKILTDRTAFNPGEQLQFKALIYKEGADNKLETLKGGEKVQLKLLDPKMQLIETKELTTNTFGSVAGKFTLKGERNGYFRLQLFYGNRMLSEQRLRVDEFVLPTFTLSFDDNKYLYYPGDIIELTGQIQAYSGHSLKNADARYIVEGFSDKETKEGKLNLDSQGRFKLSFKADEEDGSRHYSIRIKVTDSTGETHEWSSWRSIAYSLPLQVFIRDEASGEFSRMEEHDYRSEEEYKEYLVNEDFKAKFELNGLEREGLSISYSLVKGEKVIVKGNAAANETVSFSLKGLESGEYSLNTVAECKDRNGKLHTKNSIIKLLLVREGDSTLEGGIENVFKPIDSESIGLTLGSSAGPTWVCIDLYGVGNIRLAHRLVHLDGRQNLQSIVFDYDRKQSEAVRITAIYFRNFRSFSYSYDFKPERKKMELPLSFVQFEDRTMPASRYSFQILTRPGVECAAGIFDKSVENIERNVWSQVLLQREELPSIYNRVITGTDSSFGDFRFESAGPIMATMSMRSMSPALKYNSEVMVEEDAILVRENFANTLAFEPFLNSDAEGHIRLDFSTADKLSTYYVQLFAHDKEMNNAVLRREMTVTIPVKVSIIEPSFLYHGDTYVLNANVSSNVDRSVSGTLIAEFYDGKDYKSLKPMLTLQKSICIEAMGSAGSSFEYKLPNNIKSLGVKLSFISDSDNDGSDAIFTLIPVYAPVQSITEAHSAIITKDQDKALTISELRAMFTLASGANAEVREQSILDMVKAALPSKTVPASENILDLSEALYVRLLSAKLNQEHSIEAVSNSGSEEAQISDSELIRAIMDCRNDDGGFAWFKGFESSPLLTAAMLERINSIIERELASTFDEISSEKLSDTILSEEIIAAAVHYLDRCQFSARMKRQLWCGGLSFEQYLSIRTKYSAIEFNSDKLGNEYKEFKKELNEYLFPGKKKVLNDGILSKTRRISVMHRLIADDYGLALAQKWGISLFAKHRIKNSLSKDYSSLVEYAVVHKNGAWYYPNAVMPFRGLLESELHAHVQICELLEACNKYVKSEITGTKGQEIAEGIRLWLMVQKESQKWDEDPAFVEAIATILDGNERTLSTELISLSASITTSFDKIKASGNGMRIERKWYVERSGEWKELNRGNGQAEIQMLRLGDKVKAEYKIWSEENRSFIKLTAGRPASMRAVNELSGMIGRWVRPVNVEGWYAITPNAYRNVKKDCSEYWLEICPEEKSTISEEFFVTQEGNFQTPAITIESLYAPHYRANDNGSTAIRSLE